MLTEEKELGSDREAVEGCIFKTGSGEDDKVFTVPLGFGAPS